MIAKLPRAMVEQRREVRGLTDAVSRIEAELEELRGPTSAISKIEAELEQLRRKQPKPSLPRVYVGNNRAWLRTEWGGKLMVDTSDLLISPWLLLDGVWEPDVTEWFRSTLKPGMTFLDIGANVGYFSVLAGYSVGWGGRVIAFEPMPTTYELLATNFTVNWMTSFTKAEQLALFSECRRLKFYVRQQYHGNSGLALATHEIGRPHDGIDEIEVDAMSLDEYLRKNPARPDVIKIDVEGAELQVFRGARRTLESNSDMIVMCEWSQDQIRTMGDDPAEVIDELQGHHFRPYRMGTEVQPISYEELLEVRYCNIILKRG